MCKVDFPRLRLAAKVFGESRRILLCESHAELNLAVAVESILVRAALSPPKYYQYAGKFRWPMNCGFFVAGLVTPPSALQIVRAVPGSTPCRLRFACYLLRHRPARDFAVSVLS